MSSGNPAFAAASQNSPHTFPMGDILDSVPLAPPRPLPAAPDGYPEILAWAASQVRNPDLDPVAHGILTQLARFANRDGYAWPSINTLRRLAKRASRTVRAAIDRMEGLGILQVVERGWQRHANRYRLGWAWSQERDLAYSPGHVNVRYESPGTRNGADMSPQDPLRVPRDMEEERERIIDIVLGVLESLSLLPRGTALRVREDIKAAVMNPQGHVNGSYESLGIHNGASGTRNGGDMSPTDDYVSHRTPDGEVLNPRGAYVPPGTRNEPMVLQATLHDEEVTQHRLRREWLDEHWPWVQENTRWQDLGGAEKHYARFPREFQRLQERYEEDQAASGEDSEGSTYQVVDPDAENQEEAQSAWGQVLEALREQLPAPTFASYLQETEGHVLDTAGGILQVICPSDWVAQAIERRLYGSVAKQTERVVGAPVEVYFVIRAAA